MGAEVIFRISPDFDTDTSSEVIRMDISKQSTTFSFAKEDCFFSVMKGMLFICIMKAVDTDNNKRDVRSLLRSCVR